MCDKAKQTEKGWYDDQARAASAKLQEIQRDAQAQAGIRGALELGTNVASQAEPPPPVMNGRAREFLAELARRHRRDAQRLEILVASLPVNLPVEADAVLWELVTEGSRR